MKKLIVRFGLARFLGVAGLLLLLVLFLLSFLFQKKGLEVGPAEFLFAGTEHDADCCILLSGGSCVVVDTGEETDGPHIVSLLRERGVTQIDCLVLTHPDKDHIGGASLLLDSFPVSMAVMPYYGQYNVSYNALLKQMESAGVRQVLPAKEFRETLGELELTFYPPEKTFYDLDNDYSLALLVKHGNITLFLPGDAEKVRLKELEKIDLPRVDLLKTPYHGRSSTASSDLIRRLSPSIAIVNASAPESKIRKTLETLGTAVYTTVGQDRFFTSDGEHILYSGD